MAEEDQNAVPCLEIPADSSLDRVSKEPPAFMENVVKSCFTIVKAQFHLQHISNEVTNFFEVLAAFSLYTSGS